MSLYGDVEESYTVLRTAFHERFVMEDGTVTCQCFAPALVPLYAAHRDALEQLFLALRQNPRNSRYYLAIRQLHERGHCADAHGKDLKGIPSLPSREELLAAPR